MRIWITMAVGFALCASALARPVNLSQAAKTAPSKALSQNDVLSIRDGKLYLEGKRFAEISFNKFDLFWELYDLLKDGKGDTQEYRAMVASQDRALRELHEMGFRSIRFFALPWGIWNFRPVYKAPALRESVFYKAMDTALDLCDRNQIRVVYSLGAADFTDTRMIDGKWMRGQEHERELVSNPNSASRQELYRYVDDVVNRYKRRKTILMWEISNETTLNADISPENHIFQEQRMPTLLDVAGFFDDVAKRIKADDPLRLVISGGSSMRGSQWNQYAKHAWTRDTVDEQNKALAVLYAKSAIDVVDIHYYTNNKGVNEMVKGASGEDVPMNIERYMDAAHRVGKPLMIGEVGLVPVAHDDNPENKKVFQETPDYMDSYWDPNASKWVQKLCDEIVADSPQLAYWWEYSSDRPGDHNAPSFDMKKGRTDAALAVIVDANKRLKARLEAPQ